MFGRDLNTPLSISLRKCIMKISRSDKINFSSQLYTAPVNESKLTAYI